MMNPRVVMLFLGLLILFAPSKIESMKTTTSSRMVGTKTYSRRARGSTESRSRVDKDSKGSKAHNNNNNESGSSQPKASKTSSKSEKKSKHAKSTTSKHGKSRSKANGTGSGKNSKRGKWDTESHPSGSKDFARKKGGEANGGDNRNNDNGSPDGNDNSDFNDKRTKPTFDFSTPPPTQTPSQAPSTHPSSTNFTEPPTSSIPVPTTAPSNLTTNLCRAFYAGTARRTEPRQDYKVRFVLDVEGNTDGDTVLEQMGTILNGYIAPFLLGCEKPQQMQRAIQSVSSEYVNIIFSDPVKDSERTCTASLNTSICIPTTFDSELYYDGATPSEFEQELSQVLQSWDWSGLDGFQSLGRIEVAQVDNAIPRTTTSQNSHAGIIIASTAVLATLLVLTIFAKRIRKQMLPWKTSYAWLTNIDEHVALGPDSAAMTRSNKAVRFDEQITYVSCEYSRDNGAELGLWTNVHPNHPQEIECSSPSCLYCEAKRQSGVENHVVNTSATWSELHITECHSPSFKDCVLL